MASQITALPTAPSRAEPATFSTRMDAMLAALAGFVSQTNTVATEAEADAATATTQAGIARLATSNGAAQVALATEQAAFAANSAVAAASAATMTAWVSGTTYTIGNIVYSPVTLKPYIRKTNGAGTIDPADDRTNWQLFIVGPPPNFSFYQSLGGI